MPITLNKEQEKAMPTDVKAKVQRLNEEEANRLKRDADAKRADAERERDAARENLAAKEQELSNLRGELKKRDDVIAERDVQIEQLKARVARRQPIPENEV